jgi:hypothetical protein
MRQNKELERDNRKLKIETQQSMSRESKKTKNYGDIIIKKSMNFDITIGSEMHTYSVSDD